MSAPWPTAFFLGAPLSAPHLHCGLHAAPCPPGFNVSRRGSCLAFLARPPASLSVLHCCTLQVRLTPSSGLICCNLQQRPDSSAKLLQQSSEISRYCSLRDNTSSKERTYRARGIVASARRSGQEDFQRGTPPVSLASCSISPFFRACISRSDPQQTTRQTARGHQS